MHDLPWDYFRFSDSVFRALFCAETGFEIVDVVRGSPMHMFPFFTIGEVHDADGAAGFFTVALIARKMGADGAAMGCRPGPDLRGALPRVRASSIAAAWSAQAAAAGSAASPAAAAPRHPGRRRASARSPRGKRAAARRSSPSASAVARAQPARAASAGRPAACRSSIASAQRASRAA